METIANGKVRIWAPIHEVESGALTQLKNIASLPWVFSHVAAMPDTHFGKGATVGSVVAMKGAVSPAAVGVDIGCGMGAVKTSLTAKDLPDTLRDIRQAIEDAIPVGFNGHDSFVIEHKKPVFGSHSALSVSNSANALYKTAPEMESSLLSKSKIQLGTLGGGNHFIEMCLDTDGIVWLMLHSGSRAVGKVLAEKHMAVAKKLAHNTHIPDRDLSVFLAGTPEMNAYRKDLFWCQNYAMVNRQVMMALLINTLSNFFPKEKLTSQMSVWCHHNYVAEEKHYGEEVLVTRKGAIRAGVGELGIIPGSMGTKSYIVKGLGNPESFMSASHGAGRRMSRGAANKTFTVADLEAQTAGVECRKDKDVIDEIPGAYKDIDAVMNNQKDLVEVVAELKQVLCVKG